MFSICRQTHPATTIEHAICCCFFNSDETCLVTAGANILKIFRLMPDGESYEKNAVGEIIPPKMHLECLANYTLWGCIMSLQKVKVQGNGRDLLLISFREAKLAIVQYDPNSHDLATLSLHYFEEDDMKDGWISHNNIPMIRVDPENRCAVMLLYGRKLAVLPFRKETNAEDGDGFETKPLDIKNPQPISSKAPVMASYVIVLKDLDEKIDNILDIQFLHGYYEPTMLLLYEPVKTFSGRIAVRMDTCSMVSVSLNVQQRVHPVIWSTSGLPFDCLQAVAIEKPLGGCLILAINSLIYLNQSVPPYGVSLNSAANLSTNFPLKILDGVCITLDAACIVPLTDSRLVLSLKGGQLYVVNLIADSVRSVRAIHLDRAAASVLTTCMCVIEEDFLFLGSRLGNSLLLRVTDRENRMILSVDRPLETTVDLTGGEETAEKDDESDAAAKKRRVETLAECAATDVLEIVDQDELEVYGSDRHLSTQLTSHVFEVCDSLLNIGPIGDVSMGEPALLSEELHGALMPQQVDIELVTTSGHSKNGALCVLQRTIRPQVVTSFHLPGCLDMWTVLGEPPDTAPGRTDSHDSEGFHSYLLLTQEDSTMILQTGLEINEVDSSGFSRGHPTVFAGNLGNNKYAVQVTSHSVRLIKGSQMLQHINLDFIAATASVADPYLCVVSTCGRTLVMALRELKGSAHSARLAPTRQAVPSRPSLLKACAYRDLSGLFTTLAEDNIQVKGEFTGKKGKNMKSERGFFDPNVIYDVNEEDDILYGGDQTLASMATLMQVERSGQTKPPRRLSKWWRRHLVDKKPTYWLFVIRDNGNLEIYSLPDMRLSFLSGDIAGGGKILADNLESVNLMAGIPENADDPESTSRAAGAFSVPTTGDVRHLKEILVIGLGHKGTRPLMLLRLQNELYVYQVYKYPRGNLKMRFRRMELSGDLCQFGQCVSNNDESEEAWTLRDNVKQMRYFSNIAGYNGVYICGDHPQVLVLSARGELRRHSVHASAGPAIAQAAFNNANCPNGFLYFNDQSELRICVLSTHLLYDAIWPVRKVPLRMSPHFVTYHVESKTYCIVASHSKPEQSYYKFNGEDKEYSLESGKGDRFPYPLQDRFSIMLFSPVSWDIVPNTKIELNEWEHVTCLKNVSLSYEGTRSGLRGYIALGTNYNYSEDITSRGRILIYDIIDVVPEPGQPLTKNKFKEIYAKEQKGPVTALAQVLGFLISAVGQKIYIWQLKDDDLVGVAFIDTQIYVHKIMAVKNLILIADVYKSVSLLRLQEQHRTLSLVSRDIRDCQIYDMEFLIDNSNLGFFISESEGNFILFMYQPQARESFGGQKLIRKADYHLGQQVNTMFRLGSKVNADQKSFVHGMPSLEKRHVTMFATLDGGLGYVMPVSEKTYRRLLMLQNVLNNYCCHLAGLNPKAFRTYKSARRIQGGPSRGILDGDLVYQYINLPNLERQEVAKKIGTKVEEIMSDLADIETLTGHF